MQFIEKKVLSKKRRNIISFEKPVSYPLTAPPQCGGGNGRQCEAALGTHCFQSGA